MSRYQNVRDGLVIKIDSMGRELWRLPIANDTFSVFNLQIAPLANGHYLATWHNPLYKPYMDPSRHRIPQGNTKLTTWVLEFDDEGNTIKKWNLGK